MNDDLIDDTIPQLPDDPAEETPLVYPIPDNMHIGVSTDRGTSPETTDQGDEEVLREQFGQPD